MNVHAQVVLFPKNVGSIVTHDNQRIAIDTTGVITVDGNITPAVASMLVKMSDGHVYVRGLKTGTWWRYSGHPSALHWDTPGSEVANALELLPRVPV